MHTPRFIHPRAPLFFETRDTSSTVTEQESFHENAPGIIDEQLGTKRASSLNSRLFPTISVIGPATYVPLCLSVSPCLSPLGFTLWKKEKKGRKFFPLSPHSFSQVSTETSQASKIATFEDFKWISSRNVGTWFPEYGTSIPSRASAPIPRLPVSRYAVNQLIHCPNWPINSYTNWRLAGAWPVSGGIMGRMKRVVGEARLALWIFRLWFAREAV